MPRHRRNRNHGPANAGLGALLGIDAPFGSHQWRREHGDKRALTFCDALHAARATGLNTDRGQPLNVYPCRHGDTPPDPLFPHAAQQNGALHWHVGHLRTGVPNQRPAGIVLVPRETTC